MFKIKISYSNDYKVGSIHTHTHIHYYVLLQCGIITFGKKSNKNKDTTQLFLNIQTSLFIPSGISADLYTMG